MGYGRPANSGGPEVVIQALDFKNPASVKFTVEPGHPWTPPFGVESVGRPLEAVVEVPDGADPADEFEVAEYRDGGEVKRRPVVFVDEKRSFLTTETDPRYRFGRVVLAEWPDEVALWVKPANQTEFAEVARREVKVSPFEAAAEARAEKLVNPVDLGAILPPASWLVLAGGEQANVEVAALNRGEPLAGARVTAWYESSPDDKTSVDLDLTHNRKTRVNLAVGPCSRKLTEDTLRVTIADRTGRELWREDIHVMIVPHPPKWPNFGALRTKLRYDAEIPLPNGGSLDYDKAWDSALDDVVVFLPNGGRFVFWRGARNIPIWAGLDNTGFSYQWAERAIPFVWSEALLDHEVRFSRVEIIEATGARVHVRWHYRAVDEHGNAPTGDFYVEDFYFYPDGFGSRVLTLTCIPEASYEINEFIPVTPASGYPLRMLPADMLDLLWIGGETAKFEFPLLVGEQRDEAAKAEAMADGPWVKMPPLGSVPLSVPGTEGPIYRIRIGRRDPLAVIQYNPDGWGPTWPGNFLPALFGPQFDRGAVVTRSYWGYHWPLSRTGGLGASGKAGIDLSPAHNSIVTTGWTAGEKEPIPKPIKRERRWMRDGNGELKQMRRDTFAWLIGMTDANDEELRLRAQSYRQPPAIEVEGAEVETHSYYAQDRRALCLEMNDTNRSVAITILPSVPWVNPVFELENAPRKLERVLLGERRIDPARYAWDGRTLWLDLTLSEPTELQLDFVETRVTGMR